MELGLSDTSSNGRLNHTARAKASTLAGEVVDQLTDATAPEEEQQKWKCKLIHGPREFREIRRDQRAAEDPRDAKAKTP